MDDLIQWGMSTADPSVIRQCLGMMLSFVEETPGRVTPLLHAALTDSNITDAITSDPLSSSCYVRLCWCLYNVNDDPDYLKVLCSTAQQDTEASSLLAMELLCQLPYSILNSLQVNGESGNGGKRDRGLFM